MIKIMSGADFFENELNMPRGGGAGAPEVTAAAAAIIEDVRARGDAAVFEYERRFDCAELDALKVTEAEIEEAFASVDADFLSALKLAAENIRAFHSMQRPDSFEVKNPDGTVLGQRVIPLESAGIYVPGGTASYPSTVMMNAIPAKIAGVKNIIMTTPPGRDGKIAPEILAAAQTAGVTEIYKIGGAQAVAALAYGTESVPRVDKIVGPGNAYVAEAKRLVYGTVDIDMIAGPSDILIVADGTAEPKALAADMLAQSEHDRMATAILVCDDIELAEKTAAEIERQLALLPREEIARASVENNGRIIVADDIRAAVEIANTIAPEHLELCVEDPRSWLDSVRNAGSVFLGRNTPEALGDYLAGPNHTLPTSGTARFSSPLSVYEFVKRSSYLSYTYEALGKVRGDIATLAKHEGLDAHARSVLIRFDECE